MEARIIRGPEYEAHHNRSNKRMLQLLQSKNTVAVTMLVFIAIKAELSTDMELPHGLVYELFKQNENFENINL